MATTMFPILTASTHALDANFNASVTKKLLSLSRGAGVQSVADASSGGLITVPPGGGNTSDPWGSNGTITNDTWPANTLVWISNPLNAVTIAGNITVNPRGSESSNKANASMGAVIYKIAPDGTATVIGSGKSVSEMSTSETAKSFTITPTSTPLSTNDCLCIVYCWVDVGTMASGFTLTAFYAGASGATGDTFVTFTETITEAPSSRFPRNPAINIIDPALV